jgi:hypothetical protein
MPAIRLKTALGIAIVAATLVASPVLAAITGSLNPPAARPGDWVELTTSSGSCCPDAYAQIAQAGPTPVFLQLADPSSPGNGCSTRVGDMTWTNDVGHARFQVPDVQPGEYWLRITVQGACWRFGDSSGVLALSVLPPADNGPISGLILLGVGAGLIAFVSGMVVVRRRQRGLR